jgi:hypothetical protein
VICSHARLTYTEVAAVLANTRGPEAQRRADLVPHLLHLHEVYRALLKQRAGAVRWTSRPPRRRSSATTTAASRRSCRARATRRTG